MVTVNKPVEKSNRETFHRYVAPKLKPLKVSSSKVAPTASLKQYVSPDIAVNPTPPTNRRTPRAI